MSTGATESLDELLDTVLEDAEAVRPTDELDRDEAHELLASYYRHVATDELNTRSPDDVCGAALSHYRLAAERPQGTSSVRVFTPTVEKDGWSAGGRSVVEVVTDDMPFLVDSVTSYLSVNGHPFDLVIHPQVIVERDVAGGLRRVLGLATGDAASSADSRLCESWIHIEIDKVIDPAEHRELEQGLAIILRDVREAVEDWSKMRSRALSIVDTLRSSPPPLPASEVAETAAFLSWLADDHFTFLGYREYALTLDECGVDVVRARPGTGLGFLRSDQELSPSVGRLPPPVQAKVREKKLLIITKANSRATVHRSVYLDYIGVKTFGDDGEVNGECRFLGLFTSPAYTESVAHIPVLRRKTEGLFNRLGFAPRSHSGKALLDFLEKYPRDELFQTSLETLTETADAVLHIQERRQLRLFVRRDDYGRYLSCIVYLPRDRYNTRARLRMQAILASAVGGEPAVDFTARVTESVLARLYFVVRPARGEVVPDVDVAALEQRLTDATRVWEDDLSRAAGDMLDEGEAMRLVREYGQALPEAYKEEFGARSAVSDLLRLEAVDPEQRIALDLYRLAHAKPGEGRFKVYRTGEPLTLSQVLPLFTSLGLEVVDERPYAVSRPAGPAWIYDFGLRFRGEVSDTTRALVQDAFMACWRRNAEADGFNRLVIAAGLTWRQASVLRAYARYLRQGGTTFSQDYIEASLLANVPITRLLVELFEARFDPGRNDIPADAESRVAKFEDIDQRIAVALDDVASLDQDRILRSYRTLIRATLRTNYYQPGADGQPKSYTSFKLEASRIDDLPRPRPRFEIFVYSPRFEGVHLRFGYVARGGLRWSDRREDFRTEVLGLVKAQMVKNAVIVPVGAKGGFYCKELPDPAADRDAWLAEGIACYRTFISGLLDVTDNRVDGTNVPPPKVVRHDRDDAYLVVAADKGTATFSDIANEVAEDYGFWLGDAFASGGSAGYDHKAMGITARGAWVAVQRHFRERGTDAQSTDFTCVGIGDMSGDVFGNGMLLSQRIKLVAAFDHRHVFLDPTPDPAASYAERRRLFELPRSSWADYDPSLISPGGGVFARASKSIPLSDQLRKSLNINTEATTMTPLELISAILRAPVDLLWNGGIGTYVKASIESNADVGDKANDSIRVNGSDLRCMSVVEGGNLGLTQLGRIEYARSGGQVNTDFIDNSAGVDTSDHEVNIKILLDRMVNQGKLSDEERNTLLVQMTDEVGALVLTDNYEQNVALATGVAQAPQLLHVHGDWIRRLEKAGRLDRTLEYLPSHKEIAQRISDKQGLTAPELSVLMAYTKIILAEELIESDLPDDPFLRNHLYGYFPSPMRQDYRTQMDGHPLRREIIVTQAVNELVNSAGTTFFHRLSGETGATPAELARAFAIAREIFGVRVLTHEIKDLDGTIDAAVQTQMRLAARTLTERVSRWLINNRRHLDAAAAVEHFDPAIQQLVRQLPSVLVGRQKQALEQRATTLTKAGVQQELADRVAGLPEAYAALGIVDTAHRDSVDSLQAARLHFALSEHLGLDRLVERILALPRDDRWRTMARATLRDDLYAVHTQLTSKVLASTPSDSEPQERVKAWAHDEGAVLKRASDTLTEIWGTKAADLARLSVALRVVRSLL